MLIIRLSGLLPASYLAVRNDGDLTRHYSFLQGIYHMPMSTNDKLAFFAILPLSPCHLFRKRNRQID